MLYKHEIVPPEMRVDHPTIRTLAVLLTCICFLGLTGNLTGVNNSQGCRVTIPIVNNWIRSAVHRVMPMPPDEAHSETVQTQQRGLTQRSWDKHGRDMLAMCLIINNQHKDVREWVGHHHAIGANTIYLHDHRSEPPLRELLIDYIDAGIVQYTWWNRSWDNWNYTQEENPQMDVYATCIRKYRDRHQFIGFLDSDEFLVLQDKSIPSVPHLLRGMLAQRDFGGLAVHWRVFGSSGHLDPPQQGVLQAFTQCSFLDWDTNNLLKTIVNTDYALRPIAHIWELNSDKVDIVKENWQVVNASKCPPTVQNKIAIHHYMVKSKAEYNQKMARGGGSGRHRKSGWLRKVDRVSNETCLAAADLGPYT